MKALSRAEAIVWCTAQEISLGANERPVYSGEDLHARRFEMPKHAGKHFWFCRFIEAAVRPWDRCLLWVTDWGIWQSSVNWHLYYRLRQTYGEHRLIEEAPAHLFLDYEADDLVSFLQFGLGAGWNMHVLTAEDYGRVFISHDEWVEFAMKDEVELARITRDLESSKASAR